MFFTYGHIYGFVEGVRLLGINLGRHRILVPLWLIILFLGIYRVIKSRRNYQELTRALNIILLFALCFPLFQILRYEIQAQSHKGTSEKLEEVGLPSLFANLKIPAGESPPDVYYIILDSYGRSDTLQHIIKFDNKPFLKELQAMGFFIANCSQSNYANTELSLASSLNMDYLDVLGNYSKEIYTHAELYRLLQDNMTRRVFENAGYQVVSIDSGFSPTEWKDADVYLAKESESLKTYLLGGINPFEALELQKFVFVHILAPHSPFVFGAQGEIVGRKTPFTLNSDRVGRSGHIQSRLSEPNSISQSTDS